MREIEPPREQVLHVAADGSQQDLEVPGLAQLADQLSEI